MGENYGTIAVRLVGQIGPPRETVGDQDGEPQLLNGRIRRPKFHGELQ